MILENNIFKGFAYVTSPYASYFWHHSPFSHSKQHPLVPFISFPPQVINNRKAPIKISEKPLVTPVKSSNSLSDIRPQNFVVRSELKPRKPVTKTTTIKTAIPVKTTTVKKTKVKTTTKTTVTPLTTTTIPVPRITTVKKTTAKPTTKVQKTTITPLKTTTTTTELTTTTVKQIKAKATTDSSAKISLPKTIVKQTPLKTRTVTLTTTIPTTTTKIEEIREKTTKR